MTAQGPSAPQRHHDFVIGLLFGQLFIVFLFLLFCFLATVDFFMLCCIILIQLVIMLGWVAVTEMCLNVYRTVTTTDWSKHTQWNDESLNPIMDYIFYYLL